MPTPSWILSNLTSIAQDWVPLAFIWHLLAAAAIIAFIRGWRPTRSRAGWYLAAPLASVSLLAFGYGNVFNGATFAALTLALLLLSRRLEGPVELGPWWSVGIGAFMICFGLLYPHFLEPRVVLAYLLAAPAGLLPCPTLSLVIGAALVVVGLKARAWSVALALAGLFYGIFGVARLGVRLDVFLIAGSVAFVVSLLAPHGEHGGHHHLRPRLS